MADMPNRMVFDLEIARPLPSKNGKTNWDAAPSCGISTLCGWRVNSVSPFIWLLDSSRLPRVILSEDHAAHEFQRSEGVVSWNGVHFDNKVIQKASPSIWEVYKDSKHVDLMAICALIQAGVPTKKLTKGVPADWKKLASGSFDNLHHGWGLDAVGKATLGFGKQGVGGGDAPIAWQQGRYSEVASYCICDVGVTRALYIHAWNEGWLQSPERGRVRIPHEVL